MTGIELDYVEALPQRWWQRRLLHRLAILIACCWLAWYLWGLVVPAFRRYQDLRLERTAAEYPTGPQTALLSYTLPTTSVQSAAASIAAFDALLRTSRTKAGLGTLTAPGLNNHACFGSIWLTKLGRRSRGWPWK